MGTLISEMRQVKPLARLFSSSSGPISSSSKQYGIKLFAVPQDKIQGLQEIPRHSQDSYIWKSKMIVVQNAEQQGNQHVQASKFVLWVHEKASAGNQMIQEFADSTTDKTKVPSWK